MIRYLLLLIVGLSLTHCASLGPSGSWNYTVTGTPNGDYAGTMIVTKNKQAYSAVLTTQGAEVPFTKFAYDPKTMKTSGDFDFQGTPIYFDALVKGDDMTGNMSADDSKFPFKATRKK